MNDLETNLFPILNVEDLDTKYRLFTVSGLRSEQAEYYQNLQQLERLSYKIRQPIAIFEVDGQVHLAVPAGAPVLPTEIPLVRAIAKLVPKEGEVVIDYRKRDAVNDQLCLRFLRFFLQSPLKSNPRLWQPGAGRPFFEKTPYRIENGIAQYIGFRARPLITATGAIAIAVDPTFCFATESPLSAHIGRDEFNRRYLGHHFIYHFGDDWYEVKAAAFSDENVSTYKFEIQGSRVTLHNHLLAQATKPISAELSSLPTDSAVLVYRTRTGLDRGAPTALCYAVVDTETSQELHKHSILAPEERRKFAHVFLVRYLQELRFGRTNLRVSEKPWTTEERPLSCPDVLFGQGMVLSTRGTKDSKSTTLELLGRNRLNLLSDSKAGFYSTDPLPSQFIFLPRSVADSYGSVFVEDLSR